MAEMHALNAVYFLGTEIIDELSYGIGLSAEDEGFERKVKRVGEEPDRADRNVDGYRALSLGVPIASPENLPKRITWEGPKRPVADFHKIFGLFLVRKKVRDIVERLDPNVHQFAPVDVVWTDGESVKGQFYWFIVAQAFDTIHQENSTAPKEFVYNKKLDKNLRLPWNRKNPETFESYRFVFDRQAVGGAHIWQDTYMLTGPYCSDTFKAECEAADIIGVSLKHSYEVA